jgi:hypothetical protein
MKVMAFCTRDTIAKNCRRPRKIEEALVEAGAKQTQYNPVIITLKFGIYLSINNLFIAFLLKNCLPGGFSDCTLYFSLTRNRSRNSISQLWPKVSAPCGSRSGSTTLWQGMANKDFYMVFIQENQGC